MPASRRISIIIATHNRPQLLQEALDSLAAQQCPPREVIVVDDGSGPATRQAVAGWQARPARPGWALRYVHQANAGPAVARNRGAGMAQGDYVLFMDDDDLMAPDALACLGNAMAGRRDAAVSMASHALLRAPSPALVTSLTTVAPRCCAPAKRLAAMIAGHWFVPIHGYLFSREAVARMGPWEAALSSQEDDEWLLRAALLDVDFVAAPPALVYYRQHDGLRRATPGKPGETVLQGRRKRLLDDLAIRERLYTELRARRELERYRPAFRAWQRRLLLRYGDLLGEGELWTRPLLAWLARRPLPAHARGPAARRPATVGLAQEGKSARRDSR